MEYQQVWVRDPHDGFIIGKFIDMIDGDALIVPLNSELPQRTSPLDEVYPAGEHTRDVEDNCALMYLNEATLLNNIRTRYFRDKIYSYVADILIAVNPYHEMKNLYSTQTMRSYRGKFIGEMPPHVFAIADKALRDMEVRKRSQSIIVSGESGAGKTESTKYLLRYLCDFSKSTAGPIEQKILDANPILEAFGNAKTRRNNNSSRFGKFVEVHFDEKYEAVGGHVSHYLLEKSRVALQNSDERNYHIFYMMCAGAPADLRVKLGITNPDDFHYLKNGCGQYFCNDFSERKLGDTQKSGKQISNGGLDDPILDDVEGFNTIDEALARLGMTDDERMEIYTMIAAVLHLGNITFEDNPEDAKGGSRITSDSEISVVTSASLLGVDPDELRQALISKVMQTSRGGIKGTIIMVPLKVHEANGGRDALAKVIYSKLFDHIVSRINKSIPFESSSYYIGVLDIAGFEYFQVNSFEQFCINYCNEKLQNFFNEKILKYEQDLYESEGLNVPKIFYVDNQDCIDLFESKSNGIFGLLDEESKLPKPSFDHFTSEVHRTWNGHSSITLPRTSKLKEHRELRDYEGFVIRHYAGGVCYQTKQFIEKNNDAFYASLEGLIQGSSNPFLKFNFANNITFLGKLNFNSIGRKFTTQLGELMDKLRLTETNFVRCVKPNEKMVAHQFNGNSVLAQLRSSGMISVLELMEHGYPSRVEFQDLFKMYKSYLPPELAALEPKSFCEALLQGLKFNNKDFKFGNTKIFFKPRKFVEFDNVMKSKSDHLKNLISSMKLALPEVSNLGDIKELNAELDAARLKVKQIDQLVASLVSLMADQMKGLQDTVDKQKMTEDQQKLKIIQDAMEMELKRKLEEEVRLREKEENRQKELVIEIERKAEEIEDANKYAAIQAQLEEERMAESRYREKIEQERRDHDMAVRLALESNGQVEDFSSLKRRSVQDRSCQASVNLSKFYFLSQWPYSQLRDTINTSCDIELLEACRHESHRRLKIYHAWKARNRKRTTIDENERSPRAIVEAAAKAPAIQMKQSMIESSQRFFRIPFVKPAVAGRTENPYSAEKRGWWYAHFDGQYVARQMELHPEKPPILLVAGVDDMQMCELSLDETGLTRKRGAEILEYEFNKEWERNGGRPHTVPSDRMAKQS
ncbi:myosin heavy chain 95F-like isoform X2 [Athalia rosae]|uniref:myosin heavy chain 95F-like isoform X2 n=1 Tax=Athalia rosae TaxID=37344 RepID=UPI002034069F|nr:myosin heavy chain 95F-like isoform X2 [Athalia rosae]